MPYTFPLALDEFFDGLPIASASPDLNEALEFSQTGAGEILTADLGPRLWKSDVNIRIGSYAEIEQVKAKLSMLRYAGRSLLVHAMPLIAPQYDPDGTILGSAVCTLKSVASNNRELTLAGLPNDYELTVGDGLSFTYGSNPVRYAYHQIVRGGSSTGGETSLLEVVPFIRPGFALNAQVRLMKPIFKAVIVPGSTKIGTSGQQMTDGVTFSLIQTFR